MLPDHRLRFPPTRIDFENDVGITGQAHDNYPEPGSQARYDYMRLALIGLLTQQSSYLPPTQYRDGTPWFDLTTLQLHIRVQDAWKPYAEVIKLGDVKLSDWYKQVQGSLIALSPDVTFSGSSQNDNVSSIPIPISLRQHLRSDSRPHVYKNGLLQDPRGTPLNSTASPTGVVLTNPLMTGDKFTVLIRRIPAGYWHIPNVTV